MESQNRIVMDDFRRSRIDITADILSLASNGAKKTRIMYKCNLSYRQLQSYLKLLLRMELLVSRSDLFKTTTKGLQFLDAYSTITILMT
jgi:predicted transcriptional regulator